MIFVTVGTQLPFDRLIKAVDELAPYFPQTEFIAQAYQMQYKPKNIKTLEFISPGDYNNYILNSELIVSHAGSGTIVTAANLGKPIIVFPRRAEFKEHRNDHQLATCRMLERKNALHVAYDANDLKAKIERYFAGELHAINRASTEGSSQLISSIQNFIGAL